MEIQKKQSFLMPFIIMVILMSLIGLITNLNQQFQVPMQAAYLIKGGAMTNTLTTFLNFAFFFAYLVMGVPSSKFIDRHGYKTTLVFGLVILIVAFGLYEFSAYIFDTFDKARFDQIITQARAEGDSFNYTGPISVPYAYYIFLLAAFVAGSALTYLQAVVNPYLVACNVKGTSGVQRQSIAGAGNSLMTTIGPLIVAYLIFNGKSGLNIQITSLYIPIAVLIALVAVIIITLSFVNLPEIQGIAKNKDEVLPDSVWSFKHLALGVFAIFCYVGVEVAVGANINLFATTKEIGFTAEAAAKMASLYWLGLLIGRLCGSFLSKVQANKQLAFTSFFAAVLVTIAMFSSNPWFLVGMGLFHSIMWPAIFSLAMEGLGRYSAKGSGALMMGVVGGAILPFLQGVLADSMGNWTYTWIIVIVGELYLLYYALYGYRVRKRDIINSSL